MVLDFMLCILKQSGYIQQGLGVFSITNLSGTFAEFPKLNYKQN